MDISDLRNKAFSISGQVGKEYIYYSVHGEQRRRGYVIPFDPKSARQKSKRAFFRNGVEWWHNESESFRQVYQNKAKSYYKKMHGINLFLRDWCKGVYVIEVTKSIQRGQLLCDDGNNDITIEAVDINKSITLCDAYAFGSAEGLAKSSSIKGATLINSTTLRISAFKGVSAEQPLACWQVVEFY